MHPGQESQEQALAQGVAPAAARQRARSEAPVLELPRDALVVLCGPAGSGKSHFAQKHFLPSQVVSSDECRRMITDDPGDQSCSGDAFKLLYHIIDKRLKYGRLTVADTTAISRDIRRELLKLGRKHGRPVILVAFRTPRELCHKRDMQRERKVGWEVIQSQAERFERALADVNREGFDRVYWVEPEEQNTIRVQVREGGRGEHPARRPG